MGARRQYAHKRQDIFKKSYDEIIKSAKRKHSKEFYIFKIVIENAEWFSECCVDASGNSLEHWKKENGKWQKVM